jgi:hypothetical protein
MRFKRATVYRIWDLGFDIFLPKNEDFGQAKYSQSKKFKSSKSAFLSLKKFLKN